MTTENAKVIRSSQKRSKLIALTANLSFTSSTAIHAQSSEFCLANPVHFVEVGGFGAKNHTECRLISTIDSFCEMMCAAVEDHPATPIVICPENELKHSVDSAWLLCGEFLLLCDNKTVAFVNNHQKNCFMLCFMLCFMIVWWLIKIIIWLSSEQSFDQLFDDYLIDYLISVDYLRIIMRQ